MDLQALWDLLVLLDPKATKVPKVTVARGVFVVRKDVLDLKVLEVLKDLLVP